MATIRLTAVLAASPNSGPARVAPTLSLPTALAAPTGNHARANVAVPVDFVEPTTVSAVPVVNLSSELANRLRRTLPPTAPAAQMGRRV